ncbi:MAG: ABC transporter ATP-binding protein [Cumulibacter sp.]
MLSINDVSVRYGRSVQALRNVSFDVPEGEVVCVLGGNGAGKSTLLRAISATLKLHRGTITSGNVSFDGQRIDRMDPARIVERQVIQVPEGRQIFGRMSVDENLRAGGLTANPKRREAARDRIYSLFPRLQERSKQPAGLLSGGEQQMLAIGRAMMTEPKVLLLDEPSLGLAPQLITRIGQIVTMINEEYGTSILLVEQNAAMALRVSHRAVVLEVGHLALQGKSADLANSEDVQQLYLGGHGSSEETEAAEQRIKNRPPRRKLGVWTG